jgi:hypothetical protein
LSVLCSQTTVIPTQGEIPGQNADDKTSVTYYIIKCTSLFAVRKIGYSFHRKTGKIQDAVKIPRYIPLSILRYHTKHGKFHIPDILTHIWDNLGYNRPPLLHSQYCSVQSRYWVKTSKRWNNILC